MAKKTHVGSSPFTHEDDAGAPIHLSTIEGANHHFYGEPMTPKPQLEEVVLGPPPFGSPDPRTLGHRMLPLTDGPASAPELDPEWVARNRQGLAGNVDEDQLDSMKKDELKQFADSRGIDVESSATKDELKKAILDHQETNQPQPQANEGTQGNEGNVTPGASQGEGNQEPNFNSMNKAELLELASQRDLNVDESDSKADIIDALEKSNQ